MNFRIYSANSIEGLTEKNGGASAPPKDEDLRFPLSNLRFTSRFKFYRTSAAPANPIDLDYDFGGSVSFRAVGLANIRAYRGAAGVSSLEVYSSTSAYPPSAWPSLTNWTQRLAPQAISASANDVMFDLTGAPISARCWRFRIANAGQFSCRPWLVPNSSYTEFNEGFDVEEAIRRIRAPESKTLMGGIVFADLGVGKAAAIRSWKFNDTMLNAQRLAMLSIQAKTMMIRDDRGNHYEATPGSPRISWRASGIVISTRAEVSAELEQLP